MPIVCFFSKRAAAQSKECADLENATRTMLSNCKKWSANAKFQPVVEIRSGWLRLLSFSLTHPCVNIFPVSLNGAYLNSLTVVSCVCACALAQKCVCCTGYKITMQGERKRLRRLGEPPRRIYEMFPPVASLCPK